MMDYNLDKDKPVLLIVEGEMRGQQWIIHGDQFRIGRGGHCDIVIPDSRVSREHVLIFLGEDGNYYIEDLESKNGTHLNGLVLEGVRQLREGDEIQVALAAKIKFIGTGATVPLEFSEVVVTEGGLRLDPHTRQVFVDDNQLDPQLSLYQYRLLELLYQKNGGICTRDDVVRAVWPEAVEEGVSEQAIDALVRRLRDRLSEISPEHQYIVTVRGHGFRLEQVEQ